MGRSFLILLLLTVFASLVYSDPVCEIYQDAPLDSNYTTVAEVRELTGANVTLSCMCNGSLEEVWYSPNASLYEQSFNLNIPSLSYGTAGTYTCVNRMQNATVTVVAINVTLSPRTPVMTLVYGEAFLLNCLLGLKPLTGNVTFAWMKNGVTLANQNSSTLNISVVTIGDRGNYSCSARLHGVTSNSSNQVSLVVLVPQPVISQVNPVAVGTNTTFNCTIAAVLSGVVSYQWTKNGTSLSDEGRISGATRSVLNILNVVLADQGVYGCTISVDGSSRTSNAVNLITFVPVQITGFPSDNSIVPAVTTAVPSPYTIKCSIAPDATPPIFLGLQKSGAAVFLNITSSTSVSFTLQSPVLSDTAMYLCIANNTFSNDTKSFNLTVQGPVQITGFPSDNSIVPAVTTSVLSPYTIKCSIAPDVTPPIFLGLQKVLPSGAAVFLNTTSSTSVSFTLQSPVLSDTAMYLCIANNTLSNDTKSFNLTVQAPPDPINISTIIRTPITLNAIRINWTTPSSNNAPITSYYVSYCVCDQMIQQTPCPAFGTFTKVPVYGTSAVISPLNFDRYLEVKLMVMNSVGNSSVSYFMNSTTLNDAEPVNFTTVLVSTSVVIVSWALPPLSVFTGDESSPVILNSFVLVFERVGSTISDSKNILFDLNQYKSNPALNTTVSLNEQFTNLTGSYSLKLSLTSNYTSPAGMSTAAVVTSIVMPVTGSNIQAVTSVNPTNSTQLSFSWDNRISPAQRPFISQYIFRYSVSSLYIMGQRRRRQSFTPAFSQSTGATSINVPRQPYSQYTYQVVASTTSGPTIPITDISMFNTSDYLLPASAPENFNVKTGSTYNSIPIGWSVPANPNAVITGYTVTVNTTPPFSVNLSSTTFSYVVQGLRGYTFYLISVSALNTAGKGALSQLNTATPYDVCPPDLRMPASTGTSFTVSITTSNRCGPVSLYAVLVSLEAMLPSTLSLTNYWPGQAQLKSLKYYILYIDNVSVGSAENTTASFVFSGTPLSRSYNDKTYSVVAPEAGSYYITVLLYSSVDKALYRRSPFVQFTVPQVGDNAQAIIIAVVASIAVLLLLVFLVLLIVAIILRRPKVRKSHDIPHSNGDGVKTHSGGEVELKRRTKFMCPVVSVGSTDVITSAGQPTTLVCEVSGSPPPEVTWEKVAEKEKPMHGESAQLLEKNVEQPLDKQRFIQLSDHSLFIMGTDLQDEGVYVVKATNPGGTAEATVKVTVARPVPPEPDCEHPSIPVDSFTERIAILRNDNGAGLEDEYADVELEWNFTSYCANLNVNKSKNRYVNIIPYDHSRVVLPLQDNTLGSDYINSSFIDGHNKPNAYIATQGPMPSTFADFWRMIWEYDCPTIVMVTNLQEEDKVKCHQYWPSYGSTTYGHLKVTLKEVENLAEYSIRTFSVTPISGQSRSPMPVREVRQFHFLVWPDHGVPQYATALLSFRKRVTKYHPLNRGPMVVHCSAGVGRTGTFICIDYVLKQIEGEAIVDIFNFVRHMRYRRNYMVQTSAQYIFIHDAILESVLCGDTSIPASELKERMTTMKEIDPESQKMKIELQFDTLNTASPMDKDFDCSIAELPDNQKRNRFNIHLPSNNFRVTLSGEKNQSDYICASFLDGYRQRSAFIITQAPMAETVGDFWRMIWEHKSAAIVMLAQLVEDGKEVCVRYWPEETNRPEVFGKYQVEKSAENRNEGTYVIRKFKICSLDNPQDNRMITQFHYLMWPNRAAPENTKSIVELIDELQRVQRKSGNGPITVHCHDGIGRTGTFCAAYSMMDRVKVEQVVDAFQTIKSMRIQRGGLLDSLAQYIFLHSALLEFLSTFDAYQNFK